MATEALLRNCIREMSLNEFDLSAAANDGAHLALDACGIIADMTGAGAAVGAGCDAVTTAVAQFFIDLDNLAFHCCVSFALMKIGKVTGNFGLKLRI